MKMEPRRSFECSCGTLVVELTAKLLFRSDIKLLWNSDLVSFGEMEENVYIMYITSPAFCNEIEYYCMEYLIPLYIITVNQVDVQEIYLLE